MKEISRRGFIKAAGIGCGALVLTGPTGIIGRVAIAAPPTMTGVTYLTPAYKALMWGITEFNKKLQESAGDTFKVEFHDSGTLVKTDEQNAALRAGTIQYMFHTTSYITRTFKILGVTGLPGVVDELYHHGERIKMESPLWKLINDNLVKDGVFMLTAGGGILEPEYIWSAKNKIGSLADLNGKKVRVVSYEATEAMKYFGVAGVRIPSSELYLAVQRGTVDAVVCNISTTYGRRLQEQFKHCYKLPVTGFTISIFVLRSAWEKMDAATKDAFWKASQWFDENYADHINKEFYPKEYWPEMTKAGIDAIDPTPEELKMFSEKCKPILDWWVGEVGQEAGQKAIDMALGKA